MQKATTALAIKPRGSRVIPYNHNDSRELLRAL